MPNDGKAKGPGPEPDWERVARELAGKFGLPRTLVVQATRKALLALIAEGVALNALRGRLVTERDQENLRADVEAAIKRLDVYWPSQWPGTTRST